MYVCQCTCCIVTAEVSLNHSCTLMPEKSLEPAMLCFLILVYPQGWRLPLPPLSPSSLEPVLPFCDPGEEGARHEACLKLVDGADYVAKFACRAAGEDVGQWRREGGGMRSALADPYAQPDERFVEVWYTCVI